MSASLVVDLGQTCLIQPTILPTVASSPTSGVVIGNIVDTQLANTLTNIHVVGASGIFYVAVQTSNATTSGSFTDPTSGLAVMPTNFLSGGVLLCGSGILSGSVFQSGQALAAGFLTPSRYVRANIISGLADGPTAVTVIKQLKQTGSGAGFTFSPTSGSVSV